MAPDLEQVQQQTFEVLQCLFQNDSPVFRKQTSGDIETDSGDSFDPVSIADKLREVADALNEDVKFKAAMGELQQEALDKALSSGIDALVQSYVGQRAEGAPELQIIKASLAFGLYMKKAYPSMKNQLEQSIGQFLNQRVGPWVVQRGGWQQVAEETQE